MFLIFESFVFIRSSFFILMDITVFDLFTTIKLRISRFEYQFLV